MYDKLEPIEQTIGESVLQALVIHVDETGLEVNASLKWLHVYSTNQFTYYTTHDNRGTIAMNEIGIPPGYRGVAVRDACRSNFQYYCQHALCNAHLLRELTFLFE